MVPVAPDEVLKATPCTAASLKTPVALPTTTAGGTTTGGVTAGPLLPASPPPPQAVNSSPKAGPQGPWFDTTHP